MRVRYSDESPYKGGKAIFLAGPTPRSIEVPSWRPQALEILRRLGFTGTVLVPERRDWSVKFDYTDQTEWEYAGLHACAVIAFWVPRDMQTLPGLTTNVEFGFWMAAYPEKVVYGRPDNAPNTRYLDWLYEKESGRKARCTLEDTLRIAVEQVKMTASPSEERGH